MTPEQAKRADTLLAKIGTPKQISPEEYQRRVRLIAEALKK